MNITHAEMVYEALEQHAIKKLGFNYDTYIGSSIDHEDMSGHRCRTVGCIAGWTVAVLDGYAKYADMEKDRGSIGTRAGELLGLKTLEERQLLFIPAPRNLGFEALEDVTLEAALLHFRSFIDAYKALKGVQDG